MKRFGASIGIAFLLAAAIAGPAASHQTLRMGAAIQLTDVYSPETANCVVAGATWVQELGASGVDRLRFRVNLFNSYDPVQTSWAAPLSTGWMYGPSFPDDARSFYTTFRYSLRHITTNLYKVRQVGIGERPSFWETDRKLTVSAGDALCNVDPQGL
jgi:hypothetical protein